VLKMYLPSAAPGSSAAFWEENWSKVPLEQALSFCNVDPLRPLLDSYFTPNKTILEGGCGLGQYLVYYKKLGAEITGLDMALGPLQALKRRHPDSLLTAGNVETLPYRDEVFDVYYSGGVVEHFEHGPCKALLEAYRVLKSGGTFLVSVPDESLLRKLLMRRRVEQRRFGQHWIRVSRPERGDTPLVGGMHFFQYAFSRGEFKHALDQIGFKVRHTFGYSINWGLMELPMVRWILTRFGRHSGANGHAPDLEPRPLSSAISHQSWPRNLARRLLIMEDLSIVPLRPLLHVLRATSANMRMYVCRRP